MDYLVMCIGNRDGGDDAVGPYIADNLKVKDIKILDCGIVPENYTSLIKKHKPQNLIIIDAVDMSLQPGEIRIVPKEKIGVMHISTHGIPISVLINYLEQYVKNIIFIGIQPKNMSGKLTDIVQKSADNLIGLIKSRNLNQISNLE
jgi:hydrogenase 3 maturation protease